jgi:hypothetical protein
MAPKAAKATRREGDRGVAPTRWAHDPKSGHGDKKAVWVLRLRKKDPCVSYNERAQLTDKSYGTNRSWQAEA